MCRRQAKFSDEILEEGKVVKILEMLWMNGKTIIAFGFRMSLTIMPISVGIIIIIHILGLSK